MSAPEVPEWFAKQGVEVYATGMRDGIHLCSKVIGGVAASVADNPVHDSDVRAAVAGLMQHVSIEINLLAHQVNTAEPEETDARP